MNSNSNNNASASGAIDFRTLPDFLPSMCIPRVYPNISEGRIRKIFDELNIGVIDRVDIVSKTTEKGERFNRVFIHMDRWFNNSNASVARERLLGGKDIKVVYDDPWFWKISAYKPAAEGSSNNNNNNNNKKKATIQFDSSDDEKEKEKERRKPKVTDIKPLTEPRPRPYNNNNNNNNNKGGCNKARREDTFQRPVVERVKEEVVVIKQEKPYEEERPVVQRPILRDNNPKMEVPPPVQYDEAVIASTKKRVIIIRKEPTIKKETV
jgi:hypothetical protein